MNIRAKLELAVFLVALIGGVAAIGTILIAFLQLA